MIFQASEMVILGAGKKIAEAISKPLLEALENKAKWLAGVDETSKRWKEYCTAVEQAQQEFLRTTANRRAADLLLHVLYCSKEWSKTDREWIAKLAEDFEKVSLLNEDSDLDRMTGLIYGFLQKNEVDLPEYVDFNETSREYWRILEDKLFDQPLYRDLVRDRTILRYFRKPNYDSGALYLKQFIHHNENIDFVGISGIRPRKSILLDSIFVKPLTEKANDFEDTDNETSSDVVETSDPRSLQILSTLPAVTSIGEALQDHTKMIVLGDPGAGKTILLRQIALSFAKGQEGDLIKNERRFPILIRLQDFFVKQSKRVQDFSLIDYLYTQCKEDLYIELEPGFFEKRLKLGECCVCLDGFDEIRGVDKKIQAKNIISAFVNRYQKNRFIISSRPVDYAEMPFSSMIFAHYRLLPFDENAIKNFIQLWFNARIIDQKILCQKVSSLTNIIFADSRLKSLATNPLMLTIIALVFQADEELPNQRAELYEKCIATQLETWEKSKGEAEENNTIHIRYRRHLLEHMAFQLHQMSNNGPGGNEKQGGIELLLCQHLMSPPFSLDSESAELEVKAFLSLIRRKTGLIQEKASRSYSFVHLTFEEYLAACDIYHRTFQDPSKMIAQIEPLIDKSNWQMVILLLLEILSKYSQTPTTLIRSILQKKSRYEKIFHRRLFMAARAMIERIQLEPSLEQEIVDQLLDISKSNTPAAEEAMECLGSFPVSDRIKNELSQIAQNNSTGSRLRRLAINAIFQLGCYTEAQNLWWDLIRDTSIPEGTRYQCIRSIETIPQEFLDPETTKKLVCLFQDYSEPLELRCCAAISLRKQVSTFPVIRRLLNLLGALEKSRNIHWISSSIAETGQEEIAVNKLFDIARKMKTNEEIKHVFRNHRRGLLTDQECYEQNIVLTLEDDNVAFAISRLINSYPQITEKVIEFASNSNETISSRYIAVIALANSEADPYIAGRCLVNIVIEDKKSNGQDSVIITNSDKIPLEELLGAIILSEDYIHPFARIRAICPLLRMDHIDSVLLTLLKAQFPSSLMDDIFWFYFSRLNVKVNNSTTREITGNLNHRLEFEQDFIKQLRIAGILNKYGDFDPFTKLFRLYLQKTKDSDYFDDGREEIFASSEIEYLLNALSIERKMTREHINLSIKMIQNPLINFGHRRTAYRSIQRCIY